MTNPVRLFPAAHEGRVLCNTVLLFDRLQLEADSSAILSAFLQGG